MRGERGREDWDQAIAKWERRVLARQETGWCEWVERLTIGDQKGYGYGGLRNEWSCENRMISSLLGWFVN